jgi:hypothetical protein
VSAESVEIAQEILHQIGVGNLMAVGARDRLAFASKDGAGLGVSAGGGGGVMFRVGAGRPLQKVIVGLRGDDTYDVRYISAATATAALEPKIDDRLHGIYNDQLGEIVYQLVNTTRYRGRSRARRAARTSTKAKRSAAARKGWATRRRHERRGR